MDKGVHAFPKGIRLKVNIIAQLEFELTPYDVAVQQRDKGVHAFSKGIRLKVNIIAWLELELAHYNIAAQHFSHYALGTHHPTKLDVLVLSLFHSHSERIAFFSWKLALFNIALTVPVSVVFSVEINGGITSGANQPTSHPTLF